MQTRRCCNTGKHQLNSAGERTHPHPFETPVGVTNTSAKRTSPAIQPQKKTPINILSVIPAIQQRRNREEKKIKGHYPHDHTSTLPHQLRLAQKQPPAFSKNERASAERICVSGNQGHRPPPFPREEKISNLRFPHPPPLINSIRSRYLTS